MFKMLLQSFGTPEAYLNALISWRWRFFLYYILVSFICALISYYPLKSKLTDFLDENTPIILSQISEITFENSAIKTQTNKPIFIKGADGKNLFVLSPEFLDLNKNSDENSKLIFSLEKTQLRVFINGFETKLKISDILFEKNITFEVSKLITSLGIYMAYFLLPTTLIFTSLLSNFSLIFMMTLPIMLMSIGVWGGLNIINALKFSILVNTPMLIIMSAIIAYFENTPFNLTIYTMVTLGLSIYMQYKIAPALKAHFEGKK